MAAIGSEDRLENGSRQLPGAEQLACQDVPQDQPAVVIRRNQGVAIRAKDDADNTCTVPLQRVNGLARGCLPNLNDARICAQGQAVAVRAEGQAKNFAVGPFQSMRLLAGGRAA